MIRKLIRKLLGRDEAKIDMSPAKASPDVVPARKKAATASAKKPRQVRKPHIDEPALIPASTHGIDPALISRNAVRVTDTLQQAGHRAFIVGGAVRDLLLGVAPKDFDVATDATPEQVQVLFRRARLIGRRFQIVHVQFGQELIEVSTFRALVDPQEAAARATEAAAPPAARALAASTNTAHASQVAVPGEDDSAGFAAPAGAGAGAGSSGRFTEANPAPAAGAAPGGTGGRRRRRRDEPERRTHAVDASGRVLRDNVWGEQHEDARRRDFTINAMYYDPATQIVSDYHGGMADIQARLLRMIGDPEGRYREDPVRMLRVVRFAAKLGFEIEEGTRKPIGKLSDLIKAVPAARVFDEMLKLLLSGHALACLKRLRAEGLHHGLLPLLDAALEQPQGEKFITLALTNTDARIRAGKPVSPGFLFAALLWQQTQARWKRYLEDGELPVPALHRAMDEVLQAQTDSMAIQRRFVSDMKDIWEMQPRLEKRAGRHAMRLVEHQKFRAAYDFLLLRCESGELDPSLGQWWTDFITGDPSAREALLALGGRERTPRKRTRRGGRARSGDGNGQPDQGAADTPARREDPDRMDSQET